MNETIEINSKIAYDNDDSRKLFTKENSRVRFLSVSVFLEAKFYFLSFYGKFRRSRQT